MDQQAALRWVQKYVSHQWLASVIETWRWFFFFSFPRLFLCRSVNSAEIRIKLQSGESQRALAQFYNMLSQTVERHRHHFSELRLRARLSCHLNTIIMIAFQRCVHVIKSDPSIELETHDRYCILRLWTRRSIYICNMFWILTKASSNSSCSSAQDTLDCLRAVDVNSLQSANSEISTSGFFDTFVFVPVVDGIFITERPTELLKAGKVNGVRWLHLLMPDKSSLMIITGCSAG